MYCKNCGAQLDTDAAFCMKCGTPGKASENSVITGAESAGGQHSEATNSVASKKPASISFKTKKSRIALISITAVIVLVVIIASLSSFGKGKHVFDEDFPKGIEFGMTVEEVKKIWGKNCDVTDTAIVGRVAVKYSNGYIFRFDDGKLTSVFIEVSQKKLNSVLDKYGEPDRKKDGFSTWYGTANGKKCSLWYQSNRSTSGIEFDMG